MNLGELKIRVRRQFGDEASVQITDDDLTRWANDAQRDVVMKNETVLQVVGLTNSVAGQQEYSFPQDLLVLRSIAYKMSASDPSYHRLRGMSYAEFDEFIDGWDGKAYGDSFPVVYTTYANKFILFPAPVSSETDNIKIIYSRMPQDLSDDGDEIDLPTPYHNAVVDYCLSKAYELDEDWNAATMKTTQFEASIRANRERESWGNHEFYPHITTTLEDYW